ncbi:MAG: tRNA (adenosine(37)-N6)-threonylcarbamoyltransferase complex dimerization subunit type 1 TsaB [bacterium]
MTQILTIDTSTDACSAALWCDNKSSHRFIVTPQKHTKFILPMIYELLAEAQMDLNQLDAIAFGAGPGSFTGIRLAASITQGLAFAADIPVIKISCLRALAQEVFAKFGKKKVLVAQDARMQEIYWGKYQVDTSGIMQAIVPDQLLAPKHTRTDFDADFVMTGNGWKACNIQLIESIIYPQAQYMAELAVADFVKGLTVSAKEALPMYLREEVAWT